MALKDDTFSTSTSSTSSTLSNHGLVDSHSLKVEKTIPKYDAQIVSAANQTKNPTTLREQRNRLLNKDWYLRRKSYGFEKMTNESSSSSSSHSKMLDSTDSGIGRSDEIVLSPSESPKGTIVTLSKIPSATCITLSNGSHNIKQNQVVLYQGPSPQDDDVKRHSIAVDETKYVRDHLRPVFESKATSVHINGVYLDDKDDRRSKRVEFCKTEIHFAAESGRVNIVETDEKPPPTNNFRRRRRSNSGSSSGSSSSSSTSKVGTYYLNAINSGVPVTHFGDAEGRTEVVTQEQITSSSVVSVSNNNKAINNEISSVKSCDNSDEDMDENNIRGILKNKVSKPKPYLLGENIESGSMWGVNLRPVSNEGLGSWRLPPGMIENDIESVAGGGNRGFSTKVLLQPNNSLSLPVKGEN